MTLSRAGARQSLVEKCIQWVQGRIDRQVFRPEMRLPSIRSLARKIGVSTFTVVAAYERLVAAGKLEARRGSGFYVANRVGATDTPSRRPPPQINLDWLLRSMLVDAGARGPGLGVLPRTWLDGIQLAAALRSLGRQRPSRWLESGTPRGFEPLRIVIQQRLAALDVVAEADQILLTTGVTHALDLVLRTLVAPSDTVMIPVPCWFGAIGLLAAHGVRMVGIPCSADGPDLQTMDRLAREHKPKLLIMSSVAQNPTGVSLSPEMVARVVDIANRRDFLIFEDDVYADLCDCPSARLASVDQLNRVIYASGFSKSLASNVRVGYLACNLELADTLASMKVLRGFTTPELNERLVHALLVEGKYMRHTQKLRTRLAAARADTRSLLRREGVEILGDPEHGMFFWVNARTNTNEMAAQLREQKLVLAPGGLFSTEQLPSHWMRLNVTTPLDITGSLVRSRFGTA
jgi:DNA-binding transcriptional MocR family regulator